MRKSYGWLVAGAGVAVVGGMFAFSIGRSQAGSGDQVAAEVAAPEQAVAELAAAEMVAAAVTFVESLDGPAREKALIDLEDEERFNFNYVPMERRGLPLKEMTLEQRRAAHDLLQTTLSSRGYLKATGIMQLEEILYVLEDNSPRRDRELYYLSIFGSPSAEEPWGWRFEGHHLSLNYTSVGNELTAVTPSFLGSNPAEVRDGPMAGLRVLAAEEDLARALLLALDETQRARAVISDEAPNDVITSNERRASIERMEGLPVAEMTAAQRQMLIRLIEEYAHNLRPELAEGHLARIRAAGIEQLHFAWMGSAERGDPHYYRVHGPNVLFEYDNTQTNANHVHSVWRDLENDFGQDLLERHYADHPHPHDH